MQMILRKQLELLNPNKRFEEMGVTRGTYSCERIKNPEGAGEDWYVLKVGDIKVGAVVSYFHKLLQGGGIVMGIDDP